MCDKHKCSGYKLPKGMVGMLHKAQFKEHYKCTNIATINENGQWYCKLHAPSKIKEREDKKWNTYVNRINKALDKNP